MQLVLDRTRIRHADSTQSIELTFDLGPIFSIKIWNLLCNTCSEPALEPALEPAMEPALETALEPALEPWNLLRSLLWIHAAQPVLLELLLTTSSFTLPLKTLHLEQPMCCADNLAVSIVGHFRCHTPEVADEDV